MIEISQFDQLTCELALAEPANRPQLANRIMSEACAMGVYPACIAEIYRALGSGEIAPMTVPAFNIRGLTYELARVIWKKVIEVNAGPVLFELAPSEAMGGDQSFEEYAAMVFAAACREGYRGPIFLQGDHFYTDSLEEVPGVLALAREVIRHGFLQVDIDGSHLPALNAPDLTSFHRPNAEVTAQLITELRQNQATAGQLVLGGEVGEIGGRNTSVEDLTVYHQLLQQYLPPGVAGPNKISAQTGTAHSGIVLEDGTVGRMNVDFDLIAELSRLVRAFGWNGIVQHGASTLTIEDLQKLPQAGVIEVHLATQIQNIVFDHKAFPAGLRSEMQKKLVISAHGAEGEAISAEQGLTLAQQFYKARWAAWGMFKKELWSLPPEVMSPIKDSFAVWVGDIISALQVDNQAGILKQFYNGEWYEKN